MPPVTGTGSALAKYRPMKPFIIAALRFGVANCVIFMKAAGAPTAVVLRGRSARRTTAFATVRGSSTPGGTDVLPPV